LRIRRRRPGGHDITCQQAVGLVTEYLDDALSAADRERFEAHLAECDSCTEHFKQIRVTIALTGHVVEDDLDPLAREDLMVLYRRWQEDDLA
jgi:anti-sigma factor RsiW